VAELAHVWCVFEAPERGGCRGVLGRLLGVAGRHTLVGCAVRGACRCCTVRPEAEGRAAVSCDIVGFKRPAGCRLPTGRARDEGSGNLNVDAGLRARGGQWRREEVRPRATATVSGDTRGDPMSVELRFGGIVDGIHRFGVLVV